MSEPRAVISEYWRRARATAQRELEKAQREAALVECDIYRMYGITHADEIDWRTGLVTVSSQLILTLDEEVESRR